MDVHRKVRTMSKLLVAMLCISMISGCAAEASNSTETAAEFETAAQTAATLADTLFDSAQHSAYILGFDGYVRPEESITRAEICSIFYYLLTDDALAEWESAENDFPDTDPDAWYNTVVSTVVNIGLMVGNDEGMFEPDKHLTRAEFATILYRLYDDSSEIAGSYYTDVKGHWAEEEINAVTGLGLFQGVGDGTFQPDQDISRAEVITAVNRMLGRADMEVSRFQRGMTTFYDNLDTSKWYYCEIQEAATSHEYTIEDDGEHWQELSNAADAPNPYPYVSISHAGGTVDGETGTNSQEAMDISYILNMQYLEIDFQWTSDHQLVCIHDWSSRFSSKIRDGVPLSYKKFQKILILDQYTPMTLDSLVSWLKTHPGVRIVTDTKEDNVQALTLLAETYPDMMDRFIPQIYQYDEYDAVAELGYSDIILTLYQMSLDEKKNAEKVASFAESHKLWGITFAVELLDSTPSDYVSTLKSAGTQLFVHTVNDPSEIAYCLSLGIDGVYRDY